MVEDVIDGYVSIGRAAKDYGVVVILVDPELDKYKVGQKATTALRRQIAADREGWLKEDAHDVAKRFRAGELDALDLVRRYGVIVDWGTGELFENTTRQFRELFQKRSVAYWS